MRACYALDSSASRSLWRTRMMSPPHWHFAGFHLDPDNACLWHGTSALPLPPKAFALLQYLVAHAGRLVTKEESLDACWPETAVSDGVLKVHIAELRKALGETGRTPRFIATVHRRGYRFVAPVTAGLSESRPSTPSLPALSLFPSLPLLIGREAVLQRLYAAWAQACQGQRQVIWVTGEAGIGKTAVVEAFAAEVAADPTVWLAHGQCVEQYGTGEAYLPILEALGRLCRTPRGAQLISLLRQRAPTWLVQMPWLLRPEDRELFRQELQGTTRERMLRELAEVVDTLTVDTPLLLMLEDLHWSDHATLDVLSLLARRRTPARLLLLGTYRPVETVVHGHPLRTVTHELRRHGYSTELLLTLLNTEAVAAYLSARFPVQRFPESLGALLHQVTDGSPLFLAAMVEALVARSVLTVHDGCWTLQEGLDDVALGVPEDLRQMLEHQLDRVPPEAQRVLEAASVAGVTFAVAAVAAALEDDVMHIETRCEELVQRHLLRPAEMLIWPDGTAAVCYAFVHALYQQVAYERLARGRRAYLHQCLGLCLEAAYGSQATEIAAELAVHFEHGHDVRRAVQYWQQAAANAARRSGHHEVISTLARALALLTQWPDTLERTHQELALLTALGPALIATQGYAAPDVEETYVRARALCQHLEETSQRFPTLLGLAVYFATRAELQAARALAAQLLSLAERTQDPTALVEAHYALGIIAFWSGAFAPAGAHLQQGIVHYQRQQHLTHLALFGQDAGAVCLCRAAVALWFLGYPEQALRRGREALALAQQLAHPYTLAYIQHWVALLYTWRREVHEVRQWADAVMALALEQGFPYWSTQGTILQGWVRSEQGQVQEGLAQIHQGVVGLQATGEAVLWPYFVGLLAAACGKAGQVREGLALLEEALTLVDKTEARWPEAELYRVKGELLLQPGVCSPGAGAMLPDPDAEKRKAAQDCFQHALDVARQQQAKSQKLRATVSLSRLWQQQGKGTEAGQLLADVYGWFTEGFDTADLQEAKALLDALTAGNCP